MQWIIPLLGLCITGCATHHIQSLLPQNQNLAWEKREQSQSRVQNWNLSGIIAIRTPQQGWSATLQWQQRQQNYHIVLFGPLGTSSYDISGQPGFVVLRTANGQSFQAASAEELLARQAGWQLPLSNLQYWIRALPVPNVPAEKQFDQFHHLIQLDQQGWTIRYLSYTSINHIDVPNKIFLASPQLTVKIVINQWI